MDSPPERVTDTNFWIDLHVAHLLDEVFRLPCQWVIPDIVLAELQEPDPRTLRDRGLKEAELSGELVAEISGLATRYPKPSLKDLSALVLANSTGITLITGDGDLRAAAENEGVDVHGTLWVLDEMVSTQIIESRRAADALDAMVQQGRRLPEPDVEARLRRWRRATR